MLTKKDYKLINLLSIDNNRNLAETCHCITKLCKLNYENRLTRDEIIIFLETDNKKLINAVCQFFEI